MHVPFHMSSAFKFTSSETLGLILDNKTLRFTRADAFNDIYELSPFIVPLDWVEITELAKTNFAAAKHLSIVAFQRICSSLYISCFSRSYTAPESQLMWAHYGNHHKGVCIEVDFDFLRRLDPSSRYCPVAVTYVDSLLEERNRRSPTSEDLPLFIATYKGKVWAYEDEVRVVIETESFDKSRFTVSSDKRAIDVAFDARAIRKVIFGLKCDPAEIHKIVCGFLDAGHTPQYVKLDIDPLTLAAVEKPIPT